MRGWIVYGGEPFKRFFIDGAEVTPEAFHAAFPSRIRDLLRGGPPAGPATQGWPIVSDAAAVHPKQIEEAREIDRKKGVPTEYTKAGQPVFTDRAHRKKYLKAHGLRDNEGGYGD